MVAHTQLHHRMHWALPYFIWQVWMSPTLVCSMLRFVCVVHTSEHCRRCSWSFVLRTVTATTSTCCPAPEHSVSLFQQWGHAWAMLTHGDGKNSHWDSGRKSCPIVRPTCHYLTYTRPSVPHSPSYIGGRTMLRSKVVFRALDVPPSRHEVDAITHIPCQPTHSKIRLAGIVRMWTPVQFLIYLVWKVWVVLSNT